MRAFHIIITLAAFTAFVPCAHAIVFDIPVAEDATVTKYNPDANSGNAHTLKVEGQDAYTSFLKFDLNPIPDNAVITAGSLFLRSISDDVLSPDIALHYVSDDSWTETGLTWNNRPSWSSFVTATDPHTSQWLGWVEFDLFQFASPAETVYTPDLLDDYLSFALVGTHNSVIREYASAQSVQSVPYLRGEYSIPNSSVVPEPSSMLLVATGIIGMLLTKRFRVA